MKKKGLIGGFVVLVSLFGFLLGPVWAQNTDWIRFDDYYTALYEGSPTSCSAEPPPVKEFQVGQAVMEWLSFKNEEVISIECKWTDPDGEVITHHLPFSEGVKPGSWCTWDTFFVDMVGNWSVECAFKYIGTKDHPGTGEETFVYSEFSVTGEYFTLNVNTSPPGVGRVNGYDIDCGVDRTDCSESYAAGRTVPLFAYPFPEENGWKFYSWKIGDKDVFENPIDVTMDTNLSVTANFVPADDRYLLIPTDKSSSVGKIPVILIPEKERVKNPYPFGWKTLRSMTVNDKSFKEYFKTYILQWDPEGGYQAAYIALGRLLDALPEMKGKKVIIIGHGDGGIIAREFMNYYTSVDPAFSGQLGGERVIELMTLGTQNHGSPENNPMMMDFTINYRFKKPLASAVSTAYFQYVRPIEASDPSLGWDCFDGYPTKKAVCWDSALLGDGTCLPLVSEASEISNLNLVERYAKKIFAIGGNRYVPTIPVGTVIESVNLALRHDQLRLGTWLMALIPVPLDNYPSEPIDKKLRPFKANDGRVSLPAALFLGPGSARIFKFKAGKLTYDVEILRSLLIVKKAYIPPGQVDHVQLLSDVGVMTKIIKEIKSLRSLK